MSKEFEFIKECNVFFVSALNEINPVTRFCGAIVEINDELFITTAKSKDVYNQIVERPQI